METPVAETLVTTPGPLAVMQTSESTAHLCSMPVATMGASVTISGTAWRLHVGAHQGAVGVVVLQKGMKAVATEVIILGETSM